MDVTYVVCVCGAERKPSIGSAESDMSYYIAHCRIKNE